MTSEALPSLAASLVILLMPHCWQNCHRPWVLLKTLHTVTLQTTFTYLFKIKFVIEMMWW